MSSDYKSSTVLDMHFMSKLRYVQEAFDVYSETSESDSTNTTSSFSDCTQTAVAVPVCKASSSQQDDLYSTENKIMIPEQVIFSLFEEAIYT